MALNSSVENSRILEETLEQAKLFATREEYIKFLEKSYIKPDIDNIETIVEKEKLSPKKQQKKVEYIFQRAKAFRKKSRLGNKKRAETFIELQSHWRQEVTSLGNSLVEPLVDQTIGLPPLEQDLLLQLEQKLKSVQSETNEAFVKLGRSTSTKKSEADTKSESEKDETFDKSKIHPKLTKMGDPVNFGILAKPSVYSHTMDEDIREFLHLFENEAVANNWDDALKMKKIRIVFRGVPSFKFV